MEEFSESSNSDIPSLSTSIPSNTAKIPDSVISGYDERKIQHDSIGPMKNPVADLFDIPEPQSKSINNNSIKSTISQQPIPKPRKYINLFDDEPPELDTISIAPRPKSPINLFLDDDDNEESVTKKEDVKPKSNPSLDTSNNNVVPKTTVNLFDDDFDSFIGIENSSKLKPTNSVKDKKSTISSIFDDEPSEDLFDVLISKSTMEKTLTSAATKVRSLFDGNLFDDDKDEPLEKSAPSTIDQKQFNNESKVVNKPSISKNIFDDDSDNSEKDFDKLFGSSTIATRSKKLSNEEAKKSNYKINDNDFDPLFTTADEIPIKSKDADSSTSKKLNLFDDEKDDLLFSDNKNFLSAKTSQQNQIIKKTSSVDQSVDVFNSSDDTILQPDYDKLFPKVNITQKQQQQQQQKNEIKPIKVKQSKQKSNISNKTKSIFDDNDDWTEEHDELFGKSSKSHDTNTSSNLFNEKPKNIEQSPNKFRSFLDSESSSSPPPPPQSDDIFSTKDLLSANNLFDNSPPPLSSYIPENDSITKKSHNQNFPSNNSPPPLDEIDRSTITTNRNEKSSMNDRILLFSSSQSSSSLSESSKLPSIETDPEKRPKPKKLSHGLNINVKALLPGAKMPPSNKSTTIIAQPASLASRIDEIKIDDDQPSTTTSIIKESTNKNIEISSKQSSSQDHNDRLVGLTKSRPKIAGQRRASTRRGRQEQYRKSVLQLDDEIIDDFESKAKEQKTSPIVVETAKQKPIEDFVEKLTDVIQQKDNDDDDDDDWLNIAASKLTSKLFDGNNFYEAPPPLDEWLENQEESTDNLSIKFPSSPKSSSIFANISHVNRGDDDQNLFFDIPPPLNNIIDDNDDKQFDLPFDDNSSSFIEDDWQPSDSILSQKKSSIDAGIIDKSIFIDNNEKLFDYDDQIDFKKTIKTSGSVIDSLMNETSTALGNNTRLFYDDIEKSQIDVTPTSESSTVIDSLIKNTESVDNNAKLFDEGDDDDKKSSNTSSSDTVIDSMIKKTAKRNEKLFSDDDDDDDGNADDLFSTVKKDDRRKINANEQKESNLKKIKSEPVSKKKVFSFLDSDTDDDDYDDGDDLFSGNKNANIKQISNRIKDKIKSTGSKKSSGKLFDDDSDDDDDIDGDALFSSTKRKY